MGSPTVCPEPQKGKANGCLLRPYLEESVQNGKVDVNGWNFLVPIFWVVGSIYNPPEGICNFSRCFFVANWVIISYLPPIKGTRKLHSCHQSFFSEQIGEKCSFSKFYPNKMENKRIKRSEKNRSVQTDPSVRSGVNSGLFIPVFYWAFYRGYEKIVQLIYAMLVRKTSNYYTSPSSHQKNMPSCNLRRDSVRGDCTFCVRNRLSLNMKNSLNPTARPWKINGWFVGRCLSQIGVPNEFIKFQGQTIKLWEFRSEPVEAWQGPSSALFRPFPKRSSEENMDPEP